MLAFGPFVLDRRAGLLLRDGHAVELAPKPWAVLEMLATQPGVLVTKDQLLDAVWSGRVVGEAVLKVAVNALRVALGESAGEARWVQTVPRRGYRFSAAVVATRPPGTGVASAQVGAAPEHGARAAPPQPVAAQPAPPGNLPQGPASPLIGREALLAELRRCSGQSRLITLTGPGGVGKTRLSLAAAGLDAPADGVWLLRLETLTGADQVMAALARILSLPEAVARSEASFVRALAPLRVRVVLDNAEQMADGLAPLVAAWLRDAPGLQVLLTSQRPLRLAEERVLPVPPLSVDPAPGGADPSGDATPSPAVALLLHRVQAVEPRWRPDAAALADAEAIARALDGLPLALELAAARVPLIGMAGVRQRLATRLQMLTRGAADAPQRHRTLRAALEWSCALLPETARRALERLSVFCASFTAAAAQAVVKGVVDDDEWAALDALELLREMALVVPAEPQGDRSQARFRLYDSVRLYGAEQLAARGEEHAARTAHRQWLLARFGGAEDMSTQAGMKHWLTDLEPDAEDLVAVMRHGLRSLTGLPDAPMRAELVELCAASAAFCCRLGLKHELAQWLKTLRSLGPAPGMPDLSAWEHARLDGAATVLCSLGQVGPPADGLAASQRALPQLRGRLPAGRLLYLLFHVCQLHGRLGQLEAMAFHLQEMQALLPADASAYQRRWPAWIEALMARNRGDVAGYGAFFRDMLQHARAHGDLLESWTASFGLGQALFLQGEPDAAIEVLDQAVDSVREAGKLRSYGQLAAQAVVLRLMRDASPQTLQRLRETLQILRSEGMVWWLADALSWIPLWQGRRDDALRLQAWADGLVQARGEQRGPVFATLRRRFAERAGEPPEPAGPPLDEAAALRLALGDAA